MGKWLWANAHAFVVVAIVLAAIGGGVRRCNERAEKGERADADRRLEQVIEEYGATPDAGATRYWCASGECFRERRQCEAFRDAVSVPTDACAPAVRAYCYKTDGAAECSATMSECNVARTRMIDRAADFPGRVPRSACRTDCNLVDACPDI